MSQSDKSSNDLKSTAKSNRSAGGKKPLIKAVRERGLSKRKAKKMVDAVIDVMKRALAQHEEVASPIGILYVRKYKGKKTKTKRRIKSINSGEFMTVTTSRPGTRQVICLDPDSGIDLTTPEERQAEQEATIRQLARQIFGGREADAFVIELLHQLATETDHTLGQLIVCLRQLLKEGRVLGRAELVAQVARGLGARPDKDWKYWLKLVEGSNVA